MTYNIAILAGDGIGPEVTAQAKKVLDAIAVKYDHHFKYTNALVGAVAIDETGNPLPEETLDICKASDAILFGAIGHPKYDNDPTAKVRPEQGLLRLRKQLGLFCNIRPVKAYDKLIDKSPLKREIISGTDISIFRELTGGIYFGEKRMSENGDIAYDDCSWTKLWCTYRFVQNNNIIATHVFRTQNSNCGRADAFTYGVLEQTYEK